MTVSPTAQAGGLSWAGAADRLPDHAGLSQAAVWRSAHRDADDRAGHAGDGGRCD